ncbi:MAG: hypothetical protein J6Q32_03150 [Clostridia bacterium]|nr:hypothetical protein [Clostridia bacterium]
MRLIIIILIIIALIILLSICYNVYKNDKACEEKHFCNNCKLAFITIKEIGYKYCPYCGQELDYIKPNEN